MSEQNKVVGAFVIAFVISMANVPLEVFAVKTLWNWFIVPLGMQPMTWALAIGAGLFVGVFRYQWKPSSKLTHWQAIEAVLSRTLVVSVSLGVGWLVTLVSR
jgi:hypothetical protein